MALVVADVDLTRGGIDGGVAAVVQFYGVGEREVRGDVLSVGIGDGQRGLVKGLPDVGHAAVLREFQRWCDLVEDSEVHRCAHLAIVCGVPRVEDEDNVGVGGGLAEGQSPVTLCFVLFQIVIVVVCPFHAVRVDNRRVRREDVAVGLCAGFNGHGHFYQIATANLLPVVVVV